MFRRTLTGFLIAVLLAVPMIVILLPGHGSAVDDMEIPSRFDLREYNGENYVSSVKIQNGGTCWTHGTMAAMESNLMVTGLWEAVEGNRTEPNLAEYHLDWWNGFNNFTNFDRDPPGDSGIWVHYGGDYRVAAAYLSRGDGAVRDRDGQNFDDPPELSLPNYHRYYPMHVEWYTMDDELNGIDDIKRAVMEHGSVGTSLLADPRLRDDTHAHYQPPWDNRDPNHSVAIIGWDDSKTTPAPLAGAWLIKNSWGSEWGDKGYFWISYYDKWACKHPELGAVSFRNVSYLAFDSAYFHDYHGWRDTWTNSTEAFNSYVAERNEQMKGVSFYTTDEGVTARVEIYDDFEDGELAKLLWTGSSYYERIGLHTIMFDEPLELIEGNDFHILLNVSGGGIAYDRTSQVPLLLDPPTREPGYESWVTSLSAPNQSFFKNGTRWSDLYYINESSNFCIKGLVGHVSIASPMSHDMVGSTYTFYGPVSEEIDQVKVRIDNGDLMGTIIRNGVWKLEMEDLHLVSGPHILTARATQDGCETVVSTSWVEFIFDDNDPVTTVTLSGETGLEGWFVSDVEVALSGEDQTSSVMMTEFTLDQGGWTEYSSPFNISDNGVHQVSYRSLDIAGNLEVPRSMEIKIDKVSPETDHFMVGDMGSEEWYVSPVELRFQSSDATSGPGEVRLEIDGKASIYDPKDPPVISTNGQHSFSYHAVDIAGNLEEKRSVSFMIDREGPSTSMVVHGTEGDLGWFVSPVQVELVREEGYSGIETTQYRIVGGKWQEYSAPVNIINNGLFELEFYTKDLAGNTEAVRAGYVKIDKDPPETSMTIDGEEGEGGLYLSSITLTLTGSDRTSGYSRSYYQLDRDGPRLYTGPIIVKGNGIHEIRYYSVDRAGNVEAPIMKVLTLDLDDPVIILSERLQGSIFNETSLSAIVSVFDEGPPGYLCYRLDGGDEIEIDGGNLVILDLNEGQHALEVTYTAASGRAARESRIFMVNLSFSSALTGEEEEDQDTSEDNGAWLLAAILIITLVILAAVLAAVLIIRRTVLRSRADQVAETIDQDDTPGAG
ncbi:MAG: OmpL47-type beta-barrel domain-containing protein [Thermoplasmatota archaeon]